MKFRKQIAGEDWSSVFLLIRFTLIVIKNETNTENIEISFVEFKPVYIHSSHMDEGRHLV